MQDKDYVAKTMDIEGKAYVPVHERIKEFYSKYPMGDIQTRILNNPNEKILEGDVIIVKAEAHKFPGDDHPGSGHSQATHGKDYFKTSALEIAETSAIGRALGSMGIGIKGVMASADEVTKSKEQGAAQDKNKEEPKTGENEIKRPANTVIDKKIPNYNTLNEKEKKGVELLAETIKASETVEALKDTGGEIKKATISVAASEELRKEYNIRMKQLKLGKE